MSIWDPENKLRLGHIKEFPELLYRQFPGIEGRDVDEVLGVCLNHNAKHLRPELESHRILFLF